MAFKKRSGSTDETAVDGVGQNLTKLLMREYPTLEVSVRRAHELAGDMYLVKARDRQTGAVRLARIVSLAELLTDEGYELLVTQLWLAEPPTIGD